MNDIGAIVHQLTANAGMLRVLVQAVSDEQARWQPSSETWSIMKIMEHVYNEERTDFRPHLKELLNDPPHTWGALEEEHVAVDSCREALDRFMMEREVSIAWLETLESPNWANEMQVAFGPLDETITLRAGDVLVSWVDHDFLHLCQMVKKLHAWHEKEMAPYSTEYAGGRW